MNGKRSKRIRHEATKAASSDSDPSGMPVRWPKGTARRIYQDMKKAYRNRGRS